MHSVSSALRTMRHPARARERWSEVTPAEFEAFLRDYPRKLEIDPPLIHLAEYREWSDPALGAGQRLRGFWRRATKCWPARACGRVSPPDSATTAASENIAKPLRSLA